MLLGLLHLATPLLRSMSITVAVDPPPSSPRVASLQSILDTVMTIQVAHGQILVDVLAELQALRANLESARHSTPPPPFDDES